MEKWKVRSGQGGTKYLNYASKHFWLRQAVFKCNFLTWTYYGNRAHCPYDLFRYHISLHRSAIGLFSSIVTLASDDTEAEDTTDSLSDEHGGARETLPQRGQSCGNIKEFLPVSAQGNGWTLFPPRGYFENLSYYGLLFKAGRMLEGSWRIFWGTLWLGRVSMPQVGMSSYYIPCKKLAILWAFRPPG